MSLAITCVLGLDSLHAQRPSLPPQDTPDPTKAFLWSLALPGLGQIYNKEAWKVPVIASIFLTLGYYAHYEDQLYNHMRIALLRTTDSNPETENPFTQISDNSLRNNAQFLRRNRDYLIILGAIAYMLQAIDARVSAHLKSFDTSEDISFRWRPFYEKSLAQHPYAGLTLSIGFPHHPQTP